MNMKKNNFFIVLISLILVIGLVVAVVLVRRQQETRREAAEYTPLVAFSPNYNFPNAKRGDDITVDLIINSGFTSKLSAIDITMPYDCLHLRLKGFSWGTAFGQPVRKIEANNDCSSGNSGSLRIIAVNRAGASTTAGKIATLTFTVVGDIGSEVIQAVPGGWQIVAVGEGSVGLSGGKYPVSGARIFLGGASTTTTPGATVSPAPTSVCVGNRVCDIDVWLSEFKGAAGWGSVGKNNWRTDINCDGRVNLLDYEYIRSLKGFCESPPLP